MVIYDFHVECVLALPAEANPPLVINPDTVLSFAIASQGFQAIAIRRAKIGQAASLVQQKQLSPSDSLNLGWQTARRLIVKELFGLTTGETANHSPHYNVKRYGRQSCKLRIPKTAKHAFLFSD
jgi:hypothetical protein